MEGNSQPIGSREKDPFLEKAPCQVRRMAYGDLSRVADVGLAAVAEDPIGQYLRDTQNSGLRKKWLKLHTMFSWTFYVFMGTALVANDGDAYIFYSGPSKSPLAKFILYIILFPVSLLFLLTDFRTKNVKRSMDYGMKSGKAIHRSIGKTANDVFYILDLATAKDKRRRGYGSALVRAVTDQADDMKRVTWVQTSNLQNNLPFYERLGFVNVTEYTVGEDDPTWTKGPIKSAILVRQPNSTGTAS